MKFKPLVQFFGRSLLIFVLTLLLILLLLELDYKFRIFSKLKNNFDVDVIGHQIHLPSMSNTIYLTTFIYIIVAIAGALIYKEYFKWKYECERLENKITKKKKVPYKPLVILILFAAFHDVMTTVFDEITNAFEKSLAGAKTGSYIALVYIIIFLALFIVNYVEALKVKLMNDAQMRHPGLKSEKKSIFKKLWGYITSKDRLKEILCMGILAGFITIISYGIGKIPNIEFVKNWRVDGQTIELISNNNNLYLLMFVQVSLLAIFLKFILGPWTDNDLEKKSFWQNLTEFLKSFCIAMVDLVYTIKDLTKGTFQWRQSTEGKKGREFISTIFNGFMIATFMTISTCAINSFHTVNCDSFVILIPLIILCFSSFFLAIFTVRQFEKEDMQPNIQLEDLEEYYNELVM